MSANFLDNSGICSGIDNHMYYAAGPLPVPTPMTAHGVAWAHFLDSKRWRVADTVTTGGQKTLQSNWAMLFIIVHVPAAKKPPHAVEAINFAAIVLGSSSTPLMSAHSVTNQNQALCTAVAYAVGVNIDCGDKPFPGAMLDVNLNSVSTSPTLGDYVAGLFSALCAVAYAWAGAAAIGNKIKAAEKEAEIIAQALASIGLAAVQTLLDILSATVTSFADPVNFVINWFAQQIQQHADATPALGH